MMRQLPSILLRQAQQQRNPAYWARRNPYGHGTVMGQQFQPFQQQPFATNARERRRERRMETQAIAAVDRGEYDYAEEYIKSKEKNKKPRDIPEFEPRVEPWKHLLGYSARAGWRVAPSRPPEDLEQACDSVLEKEGSQRSLKVLRNVYKDHIMRPHRALSERRDRERRRELSIRDYDNPKTVKHKDSKTNFPVVYGPNQTLAYFRLRLYPNYYVIKRVLEEARSLVGDVDYQPRKVIDMGIGCGSASAAAMDTWYSIQWIHGIEPSLPMQEGAEKFLNEYSQIGKEREDAGEDVEPRATPRLTFASHLSAESSGSFDLALLAYTANELPQIYSTLAAAALLWEKLAPGGLFVMIEPGTPDGFSSVRAVRNMLIHCNNPDVEEYDDEDEYFNSDSDSDDEKEKAAMKNDSDPDDEKETAMTKIDNVEDVGVNGDVEAALDAYPEECHILAPCTHNGPCPMNRFKREDNKKTTGSQKFLSSNDGDHNEKSDERTAKIDHDDSEGEEDNDDDDQDSDGNDDDLEEPEEDMELKGFCSFVQSMPGKGGLGTGEKFSYFIAQKRVAGHKYDKFHDGFEDSAVIELLSKSMKGEEDAKEAWEQVINLTNSYVDSQNDDLGLELVRTNKEKFGRIVRAPKKRKGHIIIETCEGPGRIVEQSVTKRKSRINTPGLYAAARSARWGGFWPSSQVKET